jgi:hypothetical protein
LREEKVVNELNEIPTEYCLRTIKSVDMDEFDGLEIGKAV